MFSSLSRFLSGKQPAAREPIEVYALPICHEDHPDKQFMRVLFTDDDEYARDPIYLRKVWDRLWDLADESDQSELAHQVRNVFDWTFPDFQNPLCTMPAGFTSKRQFFAADVEVPGEELDAGYNWRDLNAGILRLQFDGVSATLLGAASADRIAHRRLKLLQEGGARRVDAVLVHANNLLFEPGEVGGPSLVLISFDKSTPLDLLIDVAEMLHERVDLDTDDPEIRAVVEEVDAGEQRGRYHHRFRLPDSLTDGYEVYATDLWIHRPYLADGQLFEDDDEDERSVFPCLAEPGEDGGIELLPHDEVDTYARRKK